MNKDLQRVIFHGLALAMGVAVVVLNIVNPLSLKDATTLLGIGLVVLSIAGLQKES